MKVMGMLEVAQIEAFTNAGKPAASSYAYRVIWISDLSQLYVSDGTNWLAFAPSSSSRLNALYQVVIGSAAQVTSGVATHSTWAAGLAAAAANDVVLILPGTWTENATLDVSGVTIQGAGYGSYLNGTLTVTTNAGASRIFGLHVGDNITYNTGSSSCKMYDIWLAGGKTLTDNGTGNLLEVFYL